MMMRRDKQTKSKDLTPKLKEIVKDPREKLQ